MNQFTQAELQMLSEAMKLLLWRDRARALDKVREMNELADKVVSMQEACQGFEPGLDLDHPANVCRHCDEYKSAHD